MLAFEKLPSELFCAPMHSRPKELSPQFILLRVQLQQSSLAWISAANNERLSPFETNSHQELRGPEVVLPGLPLTPVAA